MLKYIYSNLHGKLGPKNDIPEVFLTRKAKNKILYKIKYEIKFKLILYKMKIR